MSPQLLNLLLFVWMAFLFGGFLLFPYNPQTNRRMPTWARMVSSFVLVVAAWGWVSIANRYPLGGYASFIAVGMTLGFIGDLFMARLIIKNEYYVLAGIISFGLGHVAYIAGGLMLVSQSGLNDWGKLLLALMVWWLFAVGSWYIVVYRRAKTRSILHMAALPYALLLATTTGVATGLWLQDAAFLPLAVGAALFLLSDLLLAAELFSGLKFKMIGDVVWLLYGPGQALIVYSVGAGLMLSSGV